MLAFLGHIWSALAVVIPLLTLFALVWYAAETRWLRKEEKSFHARERQIDYYFIIKRQEQPSETDLIRFAAYPKPQQSDALASVANLGRPVLLLEGITIASKGNAAREYPITPVALPPGGSVQFIVADFIVRYLHQTRLIMSSLPPDQRSWTGEVEICLKFYSRRASRISEPHRYAIGVSFDAIGTIHLIRDNDEDNGPRLVKSALATSFWSNN